MAAGIGLGATNLRRKPTVETCVDSTAKLRPQASVLAPYIQRTTSGAAGIGLGTAIKYLRRTTSAAANNGLRTMIKYLAN
jgi:hypothetical protein